MSIPIESKLLRIEPSKCDPVEDPILRRDSSNPFIGYYGFSREMGYGKEHTGFDYKKEKGKPVFAVFSCKKVEVYVGHLYNDCTLRSQFKDNNFDGEEICKKKCAYQEGCYGVRLFLIGNGEKALYAHLSKIREEIFSRLKKTKKVVMDKDGKKRKYDCYETDEFLIKSGDVIGFTGNTGNAYSMKEEQHHLHFEYYKDNVRCNPNKIVKTRFLLQKKSSIDSEYIKIGQNPVAGGSREEWIAMFKDRARGIKHGVDRYEIVKDVQETHIYLEIS